MIDRFCRATSKVVLIVGVVLGAIIMLYGCGASPPEDAGLSEVQIVTTPSPLTNTGGSVSVQFNVTFPPTRPGPAPGHLAVPPQIDVTDVNGTSLLGGPKPLSATNLSSRETQYKYAFDVPGNPGAAAPNVYTITSMIDGAPGLPPIGTVTVPN